MYHFSQPHQPIPNLDAFIREEERKRSYSHNGHELTTVLYQEDQTVIFERKLSGDGKTVVTFLPTTFNQENDYRQVVGRCIADESVCREQYPDAF